MSLLSHVISGTGADSRPDLSGSKVSSIRKRNIPHGSIQHSYVLESYLLYTQLQGKCLFKVKCKREGTNTPCSYTEVPALTNDNLAVKIMGFGIINNKNIANIH